MITAKQCREISIQVLNDMGTLAQFTRIVADKGISIKAAATWAENEDRGFIRLVTDDNLRAMDALQDHGYFPKELSSIEVLMHHSAGMLSSICTKLDHAGVSVNYLYASAPVSDESCLVILSTDNNEHALVALNE